MPYQPYQSETILDTSYKSTHPCDHCGAEDQPVDPVETGDGFLILCEACRVEAVGGS